DHIVGFFRTYAIPVAGEAPPHFQPQSEAEQIGQGEAFLRMVLRECGSAQPIAEDLGTVPGFVREALRRHALPGYKVLRWERGAERSIDPPRYDRVSVAPPGTHAASTLAAWWADLPPQERWGLCASLDLAADETALAAKELTVELRREIVQ